MEDEIKIKMDSIEIGSRWEDTIGLNRYDKVKVDVIVERGIYREVVITDKTSNSIEYRDSFGFLSWITIGEFFSVNKGVKTDVHGKPFPNYNPNGKIRMKKVGTSI